MEPHFQSLDETGNHERVLANIDLLSQPMLDPSQTYTFTHHLCSKDLLAAVHVLWSLIDNTKLSQQPEQPTILHFLQP
jgi:hypothetical protein